MRTSATCKVVSADAMLVLVAFHAEAELGVHAHGPYHTVGLKETMPKKPEQGLIAVEVIERRIFLIRGHKVMLDADLADLYQVPTKALNQAVRRNADRFPEDFMFQLTKEEAENLRSQIVTSSSDYGGRRYLPYAFTEQGVAMLSSVLNSKSSPPTRNWPSSFCRRRTNVRTIAMFT